MPGEKINIGHRGETVVMQIALVDGRVVEAVLLPSSARSVAGSLEKHARHAEQALREKGTKDDIPSKA